MVPNDAGRGAAAIAGDGGERFDVVLFRWNANGGETAVEDSVVALDGRIVIDAPVRGGVEQARSFTGTALVVIDLAGGEVDEAAADILAWCETRRWPALIAVDRRQIDAAVALIGDADAQLLCEATPADWITALVTASASQRATPRLAESLRESEAARLARLNDEVARIAEVLARLSGQDHAPSQVDDRRSGFNAAIPSMDLTAGEVRDAIRARRMRDRFFAGRMFEDPAWDMILDLLAAHLERGQVSVSSLCIAAAVAPTTALRWIARMTEQGLLVREPDPFDKRRAFMALSPMALEGMARYVAALRENDLPLS